MGPGKAGFLPSFTASYSIVWASYIRCPQSWTISLFFAMVTPFDSEDGLMTGVLVWDLSSAFDTLDIGLFLEYFMRMASTQCPSLLKMLEHLVNTSFRGRLLQSGVPAYCGRHIVSQHFITLLLLHLK